MTGWLALTVPLCGCAGVDRTPATAPPARPVLLDDTATVGAGGFEFQVGALADGGLNGSAVLTQLSHGLTEHTDLLAAWVPFRSSSEQGNNETGQGNFSVGTRHRFIDETEDSPALLGGLAGLFPTGTGVVRQYDNPGAVAEIVLRKTFLDVALLPSYQAIVLPEPGSSSYQITHGFGLLTTKQLGERWFAVVEGSAFLTPAIDREQLFFQVGGVWMATPDLGLDLDVLAAWGDEVDAWAFNVGFSLTF